MNHPDRLKYPMKRAKTYSVPKRISWDEVLDTIGDNLKRILATTANAAACALRTAVFGVHYYL